MNWLQTTCVIYLPVVVKGAARVVVFWRDVRQGLPANTTRSPNAATMLCQRRRRWPSIVPRLTVQCCLKIGPALSTDTNVMTQHYVNLSCSLCALSQSSRSLLIKHADWPLLQIRFNGFTHTEFTARALFFLLSSTSMYNTRCLFVMWIGKKKHCIIHRDIR